MMQESSDVKNLPDYAIEKDWWMTKVLQALFQTAIGPFCRFKGGSSLSKGWGLINRYSEDVDIALSHRFFNQPIENNNQLKKLRKACRKYLTEEYPTLLSDALQRLGVEALKNMELYRNIVEHRRKFHHIGYVNYNKDYPPHIIFLPPESCALEYEQDYTALLSNFVYGHSLRYQELIDRLKELETRFHNIKSIVSR